MNPSRWFIAALGAVFVFGELVLGISLFRLQVLNVAESRESQAIQTIRRVRVPGRRGRILDRNGRVLAECRPSRCIQCNLEEFQRRGASSNTVAAVDAAIDALSRALAIPRQISAREIARHLHTASAIPLVAWQDLDEATFARFCERSHEFPGFADHVSAERTYPFGSLAAHVLGYTGRSDPEGFENDPVYFSEKEMKGRDGVESYYNRFLSGVTGEKRVTVDARGFRPTRAHKSIMDEAEDGDVAPANGLDLALTLDIRIQASLERELEGVTGAGVVLDPRDGAVLALASAPTFNPNECVPTLTHAMYATLTNAPAKRGQNRAISEDRYGHGSVNQSEAIEQSCNTFFCNLSTAVGSNAVITAARAFGLGSRTGIDIGGEYSGVVPDDEWKYRWYNEHWYPGDTCQMCIGQGMLLVTPLQMAVVAATLANGGRVYRPYLYARKEGAHIASAVRRIPYEDDAIDLVRKSMKAVVETGTGRAILVRTEQAQKPGERRRRFRLKVDCAGKTGTAEIGRGETKRKNTWIIAFAPYENPTVAIAMLVERGESGGKTVAPRVHNVLAGIFGEEEVTGGRPSVHYYEGRD